MNAENRYLTRPNGFIGRALQHHLSLPTLAAGAEFTELFGDFLALDYYTRHRLRPKFCIPLEVRAHHSLRLPRLTGSMIRWGCLPMGGSSSRSA